MANLMQTGSYKQITSSANICPRACDILGIFVSAASGTPTLTVYNSATTTTTDPVVSVFTPSAGVFYPFPATLNNGLYVVIGGTVSCTVIYV